MTKHSIFLRPLAAQTSKPKSLTIKLPPELAAELEKLKTETEAVGLRFDIDLVCITALENAAKAVAKELKKISSVGDRE